ncbi:hypothetical protein IEQ_04602, partial [Bacillus cereus BAG6X1-2]
EVDGASDKEVLFTSAEEAKPPTILAAGAGYNKKQKRPITGRFFIIMYFHQLNSTHKQTTK